jgi:hypothetical protein
MTVLDNLVESLRNAAAYNRHESASPRVVLWPDGERVWAKAVDVVVRDAVAELLILDPSRSDPSAGPATLVRYWLAKRSWGQSTPIVYLPGVSRQAFRGAAGFPADAKHLFALQFQGHFWTQQNGKDWTPFAFLTSEEGGLSLRVSRDRQTVQALGDQLENVLRARVSDLRGHHLRGIGLLQARNTRSTRHAVAVDWVP